jgi:hypothetical protein
MSTPWSGRLLAVEPGQLGVGLPEVAGQRFGLQQRAPALGGEQPDQPGGAHHAAPAAGWLGAPRLQLAAPGRTSIDCSTLCLGRSNRQAPAALRARGPDDDNEALSE